MAEKDIDFVLRLNEESGFILHNGITVAEVDEQHCRLEVSVRPEGCNIFGFVHGGLIYTMADTAAGALARYRHRGTNVTINASINYLSGPKEAKTLHACSRELRSGRSIGVYEVEVFDERQRLLATATVTMRLFPPAEKQGQHPYTSF